MHKLFTAMNKNCSNAVLVVNRLRHETGDATTADQLLEDISEISENIRHLQDVYGNASYSHEV